MIQKTKKFFNKKNSDKPIDRLSYQIIGSASSLSGSDLATGCSGTEEFVQPNNSRIAATSTLSYFLLYI